METTYNKRQHIYNELEPLSKDIMACHKNSMSIEQTVQFLKQDKGVYFETEDMNDDSAFLEILREIMWETLTRTTKYSMYTYTIFDDERISDEFKRYYLTILKKDNAWELSWFPFAYQRRVKKYE